MSVITKGLLCQALCPNPTPTHILQRTPETHTALKDKGSCTLFTDTTFGGKASVDSLSELFKTQPVHKEIKHSSHHIVLSQPTQANQTLPRGFLHFSKRGQFLSSSITKKRQISISYCQHTVHIIISLRSCRVLFLLFLFY